MKQMFLLEGLDCANCAAKIERAIGALDGVSSASVNFMTTKLAVEAEEGDMEQIIAAVKKTIKKVEPDVKPKLLNK